MALKGNQKKLDKNGNGKLDSNDFERLRASKKSSKAKGKKQAMPRKRGM